MTAQPEAKRVAEGLTPNELEVLRILNGEEVLGWTWGASMSVCLQSLKAKGLAAGLYHLTDLGRSILKEQSQ